MDSVFAHAAFSSPKKLNKRGQNKIPSNVSSVSGVSGVSDPFAFRSLALESLVRNGPAGLAPAPRPCEADALAILAWILHHRSELCQTVSIPAPPSAPGSTRAEQTFLRAERLSLMAERFSLILTEAPPTGSGSPPPVQKPLTELWLDCTH